MTREALLDANVLLRILTDEPGELLDRATAIVAEAEEHNISLVVSSVTWAEIVYLLESFYTWPRAVIADRLLDLSTVDSLTTPDLASVQQALRWYAEFQALDFADGFVAALAVQRGHGRVISFDRDLRKLPGVTAIQQPGQLASRGPARS